jgi:hypothetical protein
MAQRSLLSKGLMKIMGQEKVKGEFTLVRAASSTFPVVGTDRLDRCD